MEGDPTTLTLVNATLQPCMLTMISDNKGLQQAAFFTIMDKIYALKTRS
jgi:hypothetical protein